MPKEKFDKLNTDHFIVLTPSFSKKSFFKMFSVILSNSLFRGFLSTVSCRRVISKSSVYVGPQGNSEFCFPSTSLFPSTSPRETMRVLGKQNSLFPLRPVIKCLKGEFHGSAHARILTGLCTLSGTGPGFSLFTNQS